MVPNGTGLPPSCVRRRRATPRPHTSRHGVTVAALPALWWPARLAISKAR